MKLLALILSFVLLAGCVTAPTVTDPRDAIEYATKDIKAMALTVESNRQQGYLTEGQAKDAKARLNQALDDLDLARLALATGQEAEANSLLQTVTHVLLEVRKEFYPPPAAAPAGATT